MKVIKYKNHGICMIGGEENEHHEKFLFSFFEEFAEDLKRGHIY